MPRKNLDPNLDPTTDDLSDDGFVGPEEEAIIRERLETADEDEKTARPWPEVFEELKRRYPPATEE